jgi:hypothetical protein
VFASRTKTTAGKIIDTRKLAGRRDSFRWYVGIGRQFWNVASFLGIKDEGSKDKTECDRQCVNVRAIVVENGSCWVNSQCKSVVIVKLWTAKPVELASLSRDVISLRRKIKSFFTYCAINLKRRKPIILNNSISIEISYKFWELLRDWRNLIEESRVKNSLRIASCELRAASCKWERKAEDWELTSESWE